MKSAIRSTRAAFTCTPTTQSRVDPPQVGADLRADVAALGAVRAVAEPAHQLGERPRDPTMGPAGIAGRAGEPEAWDRRDHEVKSLPRVAALKSQVDERLDDVQELGDLPGPAVRDDQWQRVGLSRTDVQEVHVAPSIVVTNCGSSLSRAS